MENDDLKEKLNKLTKLEFEKQVLQEEKLDLALTAKQVLNELPTVTASQSNATPIADTSSDPELLAKISQLEATQLILLEKLGQSEEDKDDLKEKVLLKTDENNELND